MMENRQRSISSQFNSRGYLSDPLPQGHTLKGNIDQSIRGHEGWYNAVGNWDIWRDRSHFGKMNLVKAFTFCAPARNFTSPMEQEVAVKLVPGAKVRVTQQIAARNHTWTSDIRGTIVDYSQQQTGSWYAHSKDDKLWLDRLTLRKDDGELITLNLDEYSHIELLPGDSPAPAAA